MQQLQGVWEQPPLEQAHQLAVVLLAVVLQLAAVILQLAGSTIRTCA